MNIDTKKINEEFWNDQNPEIHALHPSVRFRNRFILNTLKQYDQKQTLIDIGCGDGELLKNIRSKSPKKELSGIDLSQKIIQLNQTKYPNITFHCNDISASTFDNESNYDVVICSEVIEHIENWQLALKNLYKLVKPNGDLILTTQSGKRYQSDLNVGHVQHFKLE